MPDFEVNEGCIEAGRRRAGSALSVIGGLAMTPKTHRIAPRIALS